MEILSPKQRLMAADSVKQDHIHLISRNEFRLALDVAMLEYSHQVSGSLVGEPEAQAYKLQGAHEFMNVLLGLSSVPTKQKRTDPFNLPRDD
jgi:hypothetical protein